MDYGGLYDREKLFWKTIQDVIITVACAPPGGGRNPLTPRFVRHFGMLLIPSPGEFTLKAIFKVIVSYSWHGFVLLTATVIFLVRFGGTWLKYCDGVGLIKAILSSFNNFILTK